MDEEIAEASPLRQSSALLGIIQCKVTASKQVDRLTVRRRVTLRRNFKHADVAGPCFAAEVSAGTMPRTMLHMVPIDIFREVERQ